MVHSDSATCTRLMPTAVYATHTRTSHAVESDEAKALRSCTRDAALSQGLLVRGWSRRSGYLHAQLHRRPLAWLRDRHLEYMHMHSGRHLHMHAVCT